MKPDLHVSEIRFIAAPDAERALGLLGWVSFLLNGAVKLDGITLRRTRAGDLVLSFPERRDASGKQHAYIRPISDAARRDVERQVFAALRLQFSTAPAPSAPAAPAGPDR